MGAERAPCPCWTPTTVSRPSPLLPLCMLQHGMSHQPLVLHEFTELQLLPFELDLEWSLVYSQWCIGEIYLF